MGLSEKFPRYFMYIDKAALGLGLMRPNTILATQSLKLYVGHMRGNANTGKLMRIQRENASVEKGMQMGNMGTMPNEKYAKQA